jgi:hypothetical protein
LDNACRFGPPQLRQIVRKTAAQIATEKSRGNTTVKMPLYPQFAESLRTARAAGIIGVDEPKKSCQGCRKARAGVAAYADCTKWWRCCDWTDPVMRAHYIAQVNREKLGFSGMEKIVAFDQS